MNNENIDMRITRTSNNLYCFIDSNGNIQAQNSQGFYKVGVTNETYQSIENMASEAIAKAEEYHSLLVEHKIIEEPRTQEQEISELKDIVKKQAEQMAEQTEKFNLLLEQLTGTPQKQEKVEEVQDEQ